MKVDKWLKSNVSDSKELLGSGYEGANRAVREVLHAEEVKSDLTYAAHNAWRAAAIGACVGSIGGYLVEDEKPVQSTLAGALIGGALAIGGLMVWGIATPDRRRGYGRYQERQDHSRRAVARSQPGRVRLINRVWTRFIEASLQNVQVVSEFRGTCRRVREIPARLEIASTYRCCSGYRGCSGRSIARRAFRREYAGPNIPGVADPLDGLHLMASAHSRSTAIRLDK